MLSILVTEKGKKFRKEFEDQFTDLRAAGIPIDSFNLAVLLTLTISEDSPITLNELRHVISQLSLNVTEEDLRNIVRALIKKRLIKIL
jgi:hypothetical protein